MKAYNDAVAALVPSDCQAQVTHVVCSVVNLKSRIQAAVKETEDKPCFASENVLAHAADALLDEAVTATIRASLFSTQGKRERAFAEINRRLLVFQDRLTEIFA